MKRIIIVMIALMLMTYCTAMAGYEKSADGVMVDVPGGKLKLKVVSEEIFRIVFAPGEEIPETTSLVVLDKKRPKAAWKFIKNENGFTVSTQRISASVSIITGAITFRDSKGKIILREKESDGRTYIPSVAERKKNAWSVQQRFTLSDNEALYGLGQFQDGIINWRGHDVLIAQANRISVVPFLLSTAGYGILWDNYSVTKYHDGGDGMGFQSEVADAIDYYFVYGPEPDAVISGYRELTGAAPMYPKWAYGYFQSKERYKSGEELIGVVAEYRKRGLPLDVIVQDWKYWGKYGWSAMKFDEDIFPHPEKTIQTLHDKYNAHIMISIWPKFGYETDIFKEMNAKGFLYPYDSFKNDPSYTNDTGVYDAYNKDARDIYWKYASDGIFSKGMDGWWLDGTEPEFTLVDTQEEFIRLMKKVGGASSGSTSRFMNPFSLMTTKGIYENQRRTTSDKRVYILTRSAFAGQQRYAATTWSGDIFAEWNILRNQISAGLNFSMAGIPYWTNDIGGFFVSHAGGCENDEYRELYVRWFQFGVFTPIFRSHGTSTPREIWRFGEKGDWAYDALEKFDHLRYRLMPYIYSLAWKVTEENYTLMRGLAFDFTRDANVLNIDDQYMFGPAFLVNPVTVPMYRKEAVKPKVYESMYYGNHTPRPKFPIKTNSKIMERKVYIPAGTDWYDFWTGEKINGGREVKAPAPIDEMPLYVRAGSIVPIGPDIQYATEKPADPIELRIYPGADGVFTIYEDENDNYNYEKGIYATIPISWNNAKKTLTIGDRSARFRGCWSQEHLT